MVQQGRSRVIPAGSGGVLVSPLLFRGSDDVSVVQGFSLSTWTVNGRPLFGR